MQKCSQTDRHWTEKSSHLQAAADANASRFTPRETLAEPNKFQDVESKTTEAFRSLARLLGRTSAQEAFNEMADAAVGIAVIVWN
jgi:hypothetical protein